MTCLMMNLLPLCAHFCDCRAYFNDKYVTLSLAIGLKITKHNINTFVRNEEVLKTIILF